MYVSLCATENTIMTVRRYSISSNLSTREGRADMVGRSDSGWGRLQEEIQQGKGIFGNSARGDEEQAPNRHSLQEFTHKNR